MNKNSKKQNIVTFVGYLWLSISVIWTFYEILDYSYNIKEAINTTFVFVVVVTFSLLTSTFLLFLFPFILDFFFDRLPDDEKYFGLKNYEKEDQYKTLLNACLLYVDDDLRMLEPLYRSISESNQESILKVGLFNSRILLRLGKHEVRVINGLILYNQLVDIASDNSDLYYLKCYILVNDLGWSLHNLEEKQIDKIRIYAAKMNIFHSGVDLNNYKNTAIDNINQTIHTLEDLERHYSLICQGYRHLISLNELSHYSTDSYLRLFQQNISKIKSKNDRIKTQGNYYYLKAEKMLGNIVDDNSRDNAISCLKKAYDKYKAVNDRDRLAKIFSLKGRIYFEYSHMHSDYSAMALSEFQNGYKECTRIKRIDEQLKNLYYITQIIQPNDDSWKEHIMEGIRLASIAENPSKLAYFRNKLPVQHFIVLRHGESEKNITNVISGEGHLTDYGKKTVEAKINEIKYYLKSQRICEAEIKILGHQKTQVTETIQLLFEALPLSTIEYNDLLRPTNLGCLKGKSESNLVNDVNYIQLQRWRNQGIKIEELDIEGAEKPESYWERAHRFMDSCANNKCSIIVCTTSVAILLTNYILGKSIEKKLYRHFDIPLCGIINFSKIGNEYEVHNIDCYSNIDFSTCLELDNLGILST